MFKIIFISILSFSSINLYSKQLDISINFESGFEFESQTRLIKNLQKMQSVSDIEKLIKDQDWIQDFSIISKPFGNKIFINIKNKKPIFVLNNKFFYDENLNKFSFDMSKRDLIHVESSEEYLQEILQIIDLVSSKYKTRKIVYSHSKGWEIFTESTVIRFGKDLSDTKIKNFIDTSNYLFENGKIPSIIDIRYKDGVALNYGTE